MMRRTVVSVAVAIVVVLATPVSAHSPAGTVPSGPFAGLAFTVVREGDTLASVATRTSVPASVIAAANGLVDGRIYAGSRLLLSHPNPRSPADHQAATEADGPVGTTYTVAEGDTLSGIAADQETSVRAITAANGLDDPDHIRIGMVLDIPAAGAPGGGAAMRCPVPGARFSFDWGLPRSGGRFHEGSDLMAPTGTTIVAPRSGRLTFDDSPRGGLVFHLVSSDGTSYYGAHLDSIIGGDRTVAAGEAIGTVGRSGNAAGGPPHLHFEIDPAEGPAVNPYPFLRRAC